MWISIHVDKSFFIDFYLLCLSGGGTSIAFCDASPAWSEDYISNLRSASENIFEHNSLKYNTKEYPIQLKPIFSAFGLKSLALTSLRSFLLFYLPLLEPRTPLEDDDDEDFLQDAPEEREPVDLVVPFKKSVKQIIREVNLLSIYCVCCFRNYIVCLGVLLTASIVDGWRKLEVTLARTLFSIFAAHIITSIDF